VGDQQRDVFPALQERDLQIQNSGTG